MSLIYSMNGRIHSWIRSLQILTLLAALALFAGPSIAEVVKINVNQADAEALQYIPGIGESKATDIVEMRQKLGEFSSLEQLLDVSGIGEKTLVDIRKYGTIEGGVAAPTSEMMENPPSRSVSANEDNPAEDKPDENKSGEVSG